MQYGLVDWKLTKQLWEKYPERKEQKKCVYFPNTLDVIYSIYCRPHPHCRHLFNWRTYRPLKKYLADNIDNIKRVKQYASIS